MGAADHGRVPCGRDQGDRLPPRCSHTVGPARWRWEDRAHRPGRRPRPARGRRHLSFQSSDSPRSRTGPWRPGHLRAAYDRRPGLGPRSHRAPGNGGSCPGRAPRHTAQLRLFLERLGRRGRRGSGVLSDLLDAIDLPPRAPQSRFELLLLRTLRAAGLPEPAIQHRIRLHSGRTAYLDFAYPAAGLAIEADSFRHHATLNGWSKDRTRNNALVTMGWRVLPVTYDDLVERPGLVVAQIAEAIGSQASLEAAGR
ncbi:MAG: endonuclease domain-containing protein [Actinomycetota bacterium]